MSDPERASARSPRGSSSSWPLIGLVTLFCFALLFGRAERQRQAARAGQAGVEETGQATPGSVSGGPEAAPGLWASRWTDHRGHPVEEVRAAVAPIDGGSVLRLATDAYGIVSGRVPDRIGRAEAVLLAWGGPGQLHWETFATDSIGQRQFEAPRRVAGSVALTDGTPAAGLELEFECVALLGDADGRATRLARAEGLFERESARAVCVTDPLGRFEVSGLDPGAYLLQARGVTGDHTESLVVGGTGSALLDLDRGSTEGIELTVDGVLAELVLSDRDYEPLTGARFELSGVDAEGRPFVHRLSAGSHEDTVSVWLPPSRRLQLTAQRDDYAAATTELELGAQTGGVVRLEARGAGFPGVSLLRPRLIASDGATVPHLVQLVREGESGRVRVDPRPWSRDPDWLGPLPPGRYRVELSGQGDRHPLLPEVELPYLATPIEVDLAAGTARMLDVPATGGRRLVLEFEALPSESARATLRSVAGDVPLDFVEVGTRTRTRRLREGATYVSFDPLPTGARTLILRRADGGLTEHAIPAGEDDVELAIVL